MTNQAQEAHQEHNPAFALNRFHDYMTMSMNRPFAEALADSLADANETHHDPAVYALLKQLERLLEYDPRNRGNTKTNEERDAA